MPRQRIKPGWQLHISEEHREPQRERDNRPASGGEKHRAESIVQHRRQLCAAEALRFGGPRDGLGIAYLAHAGLGSTGNKAESLRRGLARSASV